MLRPNLALINYLPFHMLFVTVTVKSLNKLKIDILENLDSYWINPEFFDFESRNPDWILDFCVLGILPERIPCLTNICCNRSANSSDLQIGLLDQIQGNH